MRANQHNYIRLTADMPGDQLLLRYFTWMPGFWLLGLYVLGIAGLVLLLAWRRWPKDVLTNTIFAAWAMVAGAQELSTVYNWSVTDNPPGTLLGLLSSNTATGWLFLGLGLAVGSAWSLSNATAVRGMMILALYILIFGVAAYAISFITHMPDLMVKTPVRLLFGDSPAANFYTLANLYQQEESSFGLARLVLFFPWPTCLSLAGICLVLISTCERNARWRLIGIGGGLFAVVFGFSRAGLGTLPIAIGVLILLRNRAFFLWFGALVGCFAGFAILLSDVNLLHLLDQMIGAMRESRSGSSIARDLIYETSWQAFLASPVWGWGWVGPSIISQEELPIGSHSTIYGTLYTGGIVTFGCWTIAILLTLGAAVNRAITSKSHTAAVAVALVVTLLMFSYGESLYSLVLPLMFVFFFIGGVLRPGYAKSPETSLTRLSC